jgi:hypothetical protein
LISCHWQLQTSGPANHATMDTSLAQAKIRVKSPVQVVLAVREAIFTQKKNRQCTELKSIHTSF